MSRAGARTAPANRGTRPRRPQRYDADSLLEVAVRVFQPIETSADRSNACSAKLVQ